MNGGGYGDGRHGMSWRDLRATTLSEIEYGQTLVGSDLRGVVVPRLAAVDLSLVRASGAIFENGWEFVIAAHADFRGASFANVGLWQLKAYRCDFSGADFTQASFRGVEAIECDFSGAIFAGTEFGHADPTGLTKAARHFCPRFGFPRHAEDASSGRGFFGPCDFTGSVGVPSHAQQPRRVPDSAYRPEQRGEC